jgi:hypothetical protein
MSFFHTARLSASRRTGFHEIWHPGWRRFFLLHAHMQKPDRVGTSFGLAVTLEREF